MNERTVAWQPFPPKTPQPVIAGRPLRISGFGFPSDLGLRVSDFSRHPFACSKR
jgi:hypothetical protein